MAPLRDDLDDYKLNTNFQTRPDIVSHISYRADWAHGRSRIVVEERWLPQKPALGAGSFGVVRLETRQNGDDGTQYRERAVKQLRKFDLARMNVDFKKELEALTKFSRSKFAQSQAFVKFLGWFEDEEHIFIAMEYFQHGTLDRFITQELGERDAQTIALQLLEGLRIMHEEKFTHRDLKPQNIFVVQQSPHWWVKIGDFGISKRVASDSTALRTSTGTPKYLAPEIFHYVPSLDEESDSYTDAVDIWSFACVVYEMLALQVPFVDWPRNLVAFCKGSRFPDGPLIPRSSYAGIQFIKSLLVPFPAQRPTARETLESPWLQFNTSDEYRMPTLLSASEAVIGEHSGERETTIKQADATHNLGMAIERPGIPRKSWNLRPHHSSVNLLGSQSNRFSNSALQDQRLNVEPQSSTPSSRSSTPLLSPTSEAKIDSSPDSKLTGRPGLLYESLDEDETVRPSYYRAASERSVPVVMNQEPSETTLQELDAATLDKLVIAKSSSDMLYHCNNCNDKLQGDYFHCSICKEGNFDLCLKCLTAGNHCNAPEHWMIKRNIKNEDITSSVTETKRAPWTLCQLNGKPDSELPPPTTSRTVCIVNKTEPTPYIDLGTWKPPLRRKKRWDTCLICGMFPVDNPPHSHIWELHGTGDYPAPWETAAFLVPSSKVWMKEPSAEDMKLHNSKMVKMEHEMEHVYDMKVKAREEAMKGNEDELFKRHAEMKEQLEKRLVDLKTMKSKLEDEKALPLRTSDKPKRKYFSLR